MSNLTTLREALFATLKGVQDGSICVEKAKAIGEISQVIINTAKVEVDFARANGGGQSEFFGGSKQISQTPTGLKIVNGNITTHQLK